MNTLEIEAKKLSIAKGLPLHDAALANLRKDIESRSTVEILNFSIEKELEIYKSTINALKSISQIDSNNTRVSELLTDIEDRFEILNKRIRVSLYEKIKEAKLASKYSMQLNSIYANIPIEKQSFENETDAIISNNEVYGVKAKNDGNGSLLLIENESIISVKIEANDGTKSKAGVLVERAVSGPDSGWIVPEKKSVFNERKEYIIRCETLRNGANSITVDIEFSKIEEIESICPVFENVEVVKIYTSTDNISLKSVTTKTATRDRTFVFEKRKVKYIRLVIQKEKESYRSNGKYVYETKLNQIKISSEYEKDISIITTKAIDINKQISKISIDTIDNNNVSGVDISYEIKINDSDFRPIRPIGQKRNIDIASVVDVSEKIENQIIEIKNPTKNSTGYEYELDIPQAFLITNDTVMLTQKNEWKYEEYLYTAYIFNYEDKTINTGTKYLYIDGKKLSGNVLIKSGIRKIGIEGKDFKKLFNKNLIDSYVVNGNTISVTLRNGSIATIIDTMYPYNLKLLIEESTDFIFAEKLIEKLDYKFNRNENTMRIETKESKGDVYCIFNNLLSTVSTISLRATLKSIDNKTIPKISRIIIRGS